MEKPPGSAAWWSARITLSGRAAIRLLNFDRPYPHQVFTAVIWGADRAKFGEPEKQYRDKHLCITGFISVFKGQPEMVLHSPRQVTEKSGSGQ